MRHQGGKIWGAQHHPECEAQASSKDQRAATWSADGKNTTGPKRTMSNTATASLAACNLYHQLGFGDTREMTVMKWQYACCPASDYGR